MSATRVPKAWETTWAQEAINEERTRPADVFRYGEEEQDRIDQVIKSAAIPEGCSSEIPVAPARGPLEEYRQGYWLYETGQSEWRDVPYKAGCPGRARDVFDTITSQSSRRGSGAGLSIGEVYAGRQYRDLYERVAAAGMKCSTAFDPQSSGRGKGPDFIDAYIWDLERLKMFRRAIGDGIAKDTRRKAQVREGSKVISSIDVRRIGREIITVRCLVDWVCLREKTFKAVLQAHGWQGSAKNTKTLKGALRDALGRMQGI